MKFYMIYPNQFAVGMKPIGISMLAAVLKRSGHMFRLFDTTQFEVDSAVNNNDIGTSRLEYRKLTNPERLPAKQEVTSQELLGILCEDIRNFGPDMIGLSALTDDYALGVFMLRHVKATFPQIPTIVGGIHATVDPEGVIEEACVDAICRGEGEETLLEIADAFDAGKSWNNIRNLRVKHNGHVIKNDLRPLIHSLDELPYLDWSIYGEHAFYKPYEGRVYRYGDFLLARGCLYKCSYCINVHLQEMYGIEGFHRTKGFERAIAEMKYLKNEWNLEFVKFWDETFLIMPESRIEALAEAYRAEIGLPFIIETTAESINPRTAKLLQKMGCVSASVGLETGNADMRQKVLVKKTADAKYERAFALLRQHNIRSSSFNMLALPFETKEGILSTVSLNKKFKTDAQSVGTFFPYKGTPIRQQCIEWGLLDPEEQDRWERQYAVNRISLTRGQSILKNPHLTPEEYLHLRDHFCMYVELPEALWPLIDLCRGDGEPVRQLRATLCEIAYRKRFEGLELSDNGAGGPQPVVEVEPAGQARPPSGWSSSCAR